MFREIAKIPDTFLGNAAELDVKPLQVPSYLSAKDQILFEQYTQGKASLPSHPTITDAIRFQTQHQEDSIAVHHLGDSISYKALEYQANRLAMELVQLGVRRGDAVGLFVQRSIPMVVGILACMKAGAAYVPQDVVVSPTAQLDYVSEVAEIEVVLTLSSFRHLVPTRKNQKVIAIDSFMQDGLDHDLNVINPFWVDRQSRPEDVCFILFTSGTTGKPNGVRVTQKNLANIILSSPGNLDIRPGTKVGQILNIGFDMAAWETLGALAHGATLVVRGKSIQDCAKHVDVLISTPSVLATIDPDQCPNVRTVAVAGEPCPRSLAEKWAKHAKFYNCCGPTETTIVNTMYEFNPKQIGINIGAPTPNNTVYVLDESLAAVPIGEIGEMWAGGDCVTAGYLNNPELNKDRYRLDPFRADGSMMFRTRDLGRWNELGQLEHYGRTDDQVKVRGFRVELDSISAVLEAQTECDRATTLKWSDRDLIAFVAPISVSERKAKEAIAKELPYYCVPKRIVSLPQLPLTDRGKIDKRKLMQIANVYRTEEN